ncbi:MAG: VOC family protein [Chromatiaceae bacterium]
MQKITPFLWFDHQAETAAQHYVSVFPNSRILRIDRYDVASAQAAGRPEGSVMTVAFDLDGLGFVALNGGPVYRINEAISFVVDCASQQELDHIWDRLADGGEPLQCGWLKDRFGVTWQIVPSEMHALLTHADPARRGRVWKCMLGMVKLDIETLRRASAG